MVPILGHLRAARTRLLPVFVLLFAAIFQLAQAQDYLICPRSGITKDGTTTAYQRSMAAAHRRCGPLTTRLSKTKILITAEEGDLFCGSNFKSPLGYGMKIAGRGELSLKQAVANLVGGIDDGAYSPEFQRQYPSIPILVDESLVSAPQAKWLHLDQEASLSYIDSRGKVWETQPDLEGGRHIVYDKNILGKAGSIQSFKVAAARLSVLSKLQLKTDVAVANFIVDRDTAAAIALKIPDASVGDPTDPARNLSQIKGLLEQCRGKLLVVLAHLEGGRIVVRNYDGADLGSISIQDLDGLCAREGVDLLMLGCWAGRLPEITGPTNRIFAEDAVTRLAAGLRAGSALRLLRNLTIPQTRRADEWTIAVDNAFLSRGKAGFDATAFVTESSQLAATGGKLPLLQTPLGQPALRIRCRINRQ